MKAIAHRSDTKGLAHDVEIRDHRMVADEPSEQGGEDRGPTPQELLAASLAACTAITMPKASAVASDAFFPFPDGLTAAAEAGATCAIQPGGSVRDEEVIATANERKMAMIFTGVRHFRH